MRVFSDRLVTYTDRDLLLGLIKNITKRNFRRDWHMLVTVEPLLWGSFVPTIYPGGDTSMKPLTNVYCELVNRNALHTVSDKFLEDYNSFNSGK